MVATVKGYLRDTTRKEASSDIANRHRLPHPHALTTPTEWKVHRECGVSDDTHSKAICKQVHLLQVRGLPKAAIAAQLGQNEVQLRRSSKEAREYALAHTVTPNGRHERQTKAREA